jgi:hypothetical protein
VPQDHLGYATIFTQRGKSIAIYPKNDIDAANIASDLDELLSKKFSRLDFVYVHGDFQVGKSGGIYARLTTNGGDGRGNLCITPEVLENHASNIHVDKDKYEHPFKELGLKSRGIQMPNRVVDIIKLVEGEPDLDKIVIKALLRQLYQRK